MSIATDIIKTVDITSGVDVNYRVTSTWYDGSLMNDSKLDGDIFRKKDGVYYKKTIGSDEIVKIDTIFDLRSTNAYYEGQVVELLGYYSTGDKPSIKYKFTVLNHDTLIDDGGSIIKTNRGSWIAQFGDEIDISHFGCYPDDLNFDNAPQLQKAADLGKPLIIRKYNDKFYFINKRIRLYNSIKGIDFPIIKVNPEVNTFVPTSGYKIDRYTAFTVFNKLDENWLVIEGLEIDGNYDGLHKTGSEFEHNIHISCSKNIIIRNNKLLNPCGDNVYIGKNSANQGAATVDFCSDIFIYENEMINQGRCGVALVSCKNVTIRSNHIEKIWSYVCPIDLEPNGEQVDLLVQNITIDNNIIIGKESAYGINVYGASDYTYGAIPYPAVDFSTKDIVITNNYIEAKVEAINIAASWGKIANVFIDKNTIKAPQMINVSGTYRTQNINLTNNKPSDTLSYCNLGTIQYTDSMNISGNVSRANVGQSILLSRTKGVNIFDNNIISEGAVPCIRLANDIDNVNIHNNKAFANSNCILFNDTSIITNLVIENNDFESVTDNIISTSVVIDGINIGKNSWKTPTLKYLTNSPAFFTNSKGSDFNGRKDFYVSNLPDIASLSNNEHGYVWHKKITSLSQYNSLTVEADKYIYMNGSFIGVGFKGEWFGDGTTLPTTNSKVGQRYTNVNGGIGNTFFIREGSTFRPVQLIYSGTTSNRPSSSRPVGFTYFDTSIGKPVWWNGTSWLDVSPVATTSTLGLVKQSSAVVDVAAQNSSQVSIPDSSAVSIPDLVIISTEDTVVTSITDATGTYGTNEQALINDLKSKYNVMVALVNELKAKLNLNVALTNDEKVKINSNVALVNDIKSKYNVASTLSNSNKTQLNAKLAADRISGQQLT